MERINTQFNAGITSLVLMILFLSLLAIPTTVVKAQKNGIITGQVMEANTNNFLPGANIILEGKNIGAATDKSGKFRITNVPPGDYVLTVSYIGYQKYSEDIVVVAARTLELKIEINYQNVAIGDVLVEALAQGQVKALNQQKSADNIKNIISEEQIRGFPDINSAEVMQRVPGVSISRDQGEGRYVLIRGSEARLSSTSINGQKIATPESDRRQVPLDIIPADQLASVVITKAITPDMDGDAIGGAVNLVTKNALDYDKRILSVNLGSGYNNLMKEPLYRGNLTFGDAFADRTFGVMFSLSYSQSNMGSDNVEPEWGSEDDVNDNEIPWALQNGELRDYEIQRVRFGSSLSLEYQPSDLSKYFLRGIYNQYNDDEKRRRLRFRPEKGDYISPTEIEEAAFDRSLKDRTQDQQIASIVFGGENKLENWVLDYYLAYSYADEKEPDKYASDFELDEDPNITLDLSDPDLPKYKITNLADGYEFDTDHYVLDGIEVEDNSTSNSDFTAGLNLKVPLNIGDYQTVLKFGGKTVFRNKDQEKATTEYSWEGDDDILLTQLFGDFEDENFMSGNYKIGKTQDPQKIRDFVDANKGGNLEGEFNHESDAEDYNATEDVYAAYTQFTTNIGDWMLLFGARNEYTKTSYTGYEVQFDVEGDYESTTQLTSDTSYNHFLPMVHLRWKLTPNTNLRFAYTSGIARPNYYDLVPYKIVINEDEEMEIGNPGLKTTTSYNLDLMVEHYFHGIGLLSGGAFYKGLGNIIYEFSFEQVGGQYDGYEVFQSIQGGDGNLFGFELNWAQQLSFLPGFWNGFGVYINYTFVESDATVGERDNVPLPGQAGNVGNFALSYQKYGFTARIGLNYNDSFLVQLGEDEDNDIFYDEHLQLDFTASYNILSSLRIYAQFINLNDSKLLNYIGKRNRPIQNEVYSWWTNFGLRWEM